MNKIKKFLHKVRVVCGGGHMVCIKKGCNAYHGLTTKEHMLFFSQKMSRNFSEGLSRGLGGGSNANS